VKLDLKQVNLPKLKRKIVSKIPKLKLLNSNKNVIITVLVFSILLSGIFIFSNPSKDTSSLISAESSNEVLEAAITENLVTAYGLYIDGAFIAATNHKADISASLDTLLNGKVSSLSVSDVTSAQFMNEIKIENGQYASESVVDIASLKKLLGIEDEYTYTFNLKSVTGEEVNCDLSVVVYAKTSEEVEIAYETDYIDTDLKKSGYEKVVCTGSTGTGIAYYELVYINEELVQKNFISKDTVVQPEPEVVERGVLSAEKTVNSIGVLTFPYPGRISSYFGSRSLGYHEGIDIIAYSGNCYGDDVYAAADGVVTFAGTNAGYGTVVFIDHGEGLVTGYAHLSSMSMKEGDIVKTGDVVGQIGTTGRVTGPHLHFEVQLNEVKVDPMLFLKVD